MRLLKLKLPVGVERLCAALYQAGGVPYLVGGAVRDVLLGRPVKDYDLEVFGLRPDVLAAHLERHGKLDAVGSAFQVYKVSGLEGVDGAVDVSIPRRDSKVGAGHRGIVADADPSLSPFEAARRRDFTVNALMYNVAHKSLLNTHGGLEDLQNKVLRAVDASTFVEDPLRALRAVQFAARFGFTVEPATAALCASMPLAELPAERVFGEVEKLLKAPRPSVGFELLKEWGQLSVVAPELLDTVGVPQEHEWHPEGDVWVHTMQVVDVAAGLVEGLEYPKQLTVVLASLCHDLGKVGTTEFKDGRLRSHGHEEAGLPPTTALLDRWGVFSVAGYDVRSQVLALVADHLKPGVLYATKKVSDGAIRRLARKVDPALLYRVAKADCLGRKPGNFEPVAMEWFKERVEALKVEVGGPKALLMGRDLLALGMKPGPSMGKVLAAVYELQLDGAVSTHEEALEAGKRVMFEHDAQVLRKFGTF